MDIEFNIFSQANSCFFEEHPLLDQSLFPPPERLGGLSSGLGGSEKFDIPILTPSNLSSTFIVNSNFSELHPSLDPFVGASEIVNGEAVNISFLQVSDSLKHFIQQPNYLDCLQVAFGSEWEPEIGTDLLNDLAEGENLPTIKIVKAQELQAQGGFSQQTNTIYLAQEFIAQNSTDVIARVITEELGHYIDARLNIVDRPGDEGQLFAALVNNIELTPAQLQAIKAEDDHRIVTINGQTLLVEQSINEIVGTGGRDVLTGTPLSDRIIGGGGADLITGGLGSDTFVYQSIRDAGDTIKDFELHQDVIDLSQVLSSFGYQGLNPIADGYIKFSTYTGGTTILLDSDGQGSLSARPYIYVDKVTPTDLSSYPSHFIPNPGKAPQIQASLVNDTGASASDRLTIDPTVAGQIKDATSLLANLNSKGFVDISAALNQDGSFTISLAEYDLLSNGVLPDGNYTLELKAKNLSGQESQIVKVSFTLDLTPPSVTFNLAPASDTGLLGDRITSDRFVTLLGKTEPGLTVALLETQTTITADSQGNFSFTDVPMPVAGKAPLTIVAVDAAGNQGRTSQFFTREGINGAPKITSTPGAVFEPKTQKTYTYQVVATDPDGDNLTYTLTKAPLGAKIDEKGVLSFTPSTDLKPFYDFTVEVSDRRGGTDTQTFRVEVPALANLGTIRGIKWNDLNGNGTRDDDVLSEEIELINNFSRGYYNSAIGDLYPGNPTNILASYFPGPNVSTGDPRAEFLIAPDISRVNQLGNWLTDPQNAIDLLFGSNLQNIPKTWDVNSETAIIYEVDGGEFGITNVKGSFGVDNGIYIWVNGEYKFGAISGGYSIPGEYQVDLGSFSPGKNYIQILREDSGGSTGFDIKVTGNRIEQIPEPGLAGVTVYLDLNNNGKLDPEEPAQVTAEDSSNTPNVDETGQYEFNNLAPGTYIVREIIPDGFEQTFPRRNVTQPGNGYADVILEFVSGGNAPSPLVEPYGSTGGVAPSSPFNGNGTYTVKPVNPEVILGAPPPSPIIGSNPNVDWLALPQGSYVTVGFSDKVVIDGPGNDIFIRSFDPQDSANESANVFVSSNGVDFEFLGTVNEQGLVSLDLADINFTQPVTAVRVQGLDNRGTSPGFDLIGVEILPGSIASPDFYTVQLEAREVVENIDFGNVSITTNKNPIITSTPIIEAVVGQPYEYLVHAKDSDGDPLTFSLNKAPEGMEIDKFGKITWNPIAIGEFALEIEVSDGRGGVDTQVYNLRVVNKVSEDTQAPQVNLGFNSTVFKLGETLNLQIQGFDNVGLADLDLSFNGNSLVLTPDTVANDFVNTAAVTLNKIGVFEVVAKAIDLAGNLDTETISVRVIDPSDITIPKVELDLSGFDPLNPVITNLTNIVGTINDPNIEFYRVELAPVSLINLSNPGANDPDYITVAEGRGNINNGVLAQIDPSLYRNDSYYIRVYAQDYSGNINVQGVTLGINTETKPGHFALEFTDLSIPLTGIPIEIQRRYDSLDAKFSGDFGYGWSLGLQDAQIQEAAPTGVDLSRDDFFGGNSFTVGTRVTLTTPDGRRVGFTFNPIPDASGLLGVRYKPNFTPDAGVYDRLEVDYTPLKVSSDGSVGLYLFGFTYNPSEYRLITKDGTTYHYDQYKGLLDITDRNGNKLTYTDAGIFSSTGQSIGFKRDVQGRITEIIDPVGKAIVYNYDAQGNLVGVTDQEGLSSTHTYLSNLPDYLEQIIDSRGNAVIKTKYDAQGRVIGTTDALNNIISNSYDVNATGSTTTQVDPLGNTTTITRDNKGNIISTRDEVGAITTFTYDANNNPLTITDPRGFTTTRTFDTRGNLTSITDALGSTRILTYDEFNNVKSETDSLGHTTQFAYNAKGNLIELTDATGQKDRFSYDNIGRVSSFTDANGNSITFAYDGTTLNKPTQVTFADGSTQKIEYNQFGQITRLVDENGNVTSYVTDSVGRLISQVDPLGNQTTYTYDAQLIASITDPLGNKMSYEYDDAGRLIRQIDPLNGVIKFSYDALGRRISETNPLGNQTTTTYRGDGLITAITDANGNTTSFEYDLAGNQTAVIDPLGNRTVFGYDALERQINQTDPLGKITKYSYDAVNNLIGIIDRNNRQRTFTYDAVNRLLQEKWLNDGNVVQTTNFTYDGVGNLLSVINPDSTNIFSYDSRDRVTQASTNILGLSPVVFNYGYDRKGNRTSVSDNLGVSVKSTYDSRNLLTSQIWQGTGINPARVDYSYDSRGDRTQIQRFSNLAGTQLVGSSTFSYDALQRLTGLTHLDATGSTLASYNYTYNLASLLTSETYKGQTTNYTYDPANQLTNADKSLLPDENYTYDANGNPSVSGFIVSTNNQILSDGQFNYTYDGEGNLATKTNISTGLLTTYNYDFRNRLVEVVDKDATGNTTQSVEFKYDAFGRRISKTVNGQITYFVNDGDNLWAELNPAKEIISRYLQGTNVDELVARYRPGEGTSWYLTDRLGTIRDIVNAVGNFASSIDYNSFGKILGQTTPSVGDRFTFAGREFDSETGLYYNRARYYDANLGRFISQDPIGFEGEDGNLYRYVGNDPVNATDPGGLLVALEYNLISREVEFGTTGSIAGAIIGFGQGFGATNLIFIGNILEIANAGGDVIAEWGTAVEKTEKKIKEIADLYNTISKVDTGAGIVGGFVKGVENPNFKIVIPLLESPNPFSSVSLEIKSFEPIEIPVEHGGFIEGYKIALQRLKNIR